MKNYIKIILFSFLLFISCIKITAEDSTIVDESEVIGNYINNFSGYELSIRPDNTRGVMIERHYNEEYDRYAFCIESDRVFSTKNNTYYRTKNYDMRLYKLARAFYEHGKFEDDYYGTAQNMYWDLVGNSFTYNGVSSYNEEIEAIYNELINSYTDDVLYEKVSEEIEVIADREYILTGYDFESYSVEYNDIELLNLSSSELKYRISADAKNPYIKLKQIRDEYDFVYASKRYQDIYIYEGGFGKLKDITINFKVNVLKDITYTKKDLNGKDLLNTEFSFYDLNADTFDSQLSFIHLNIEFDVLNILENIEEYDLNMLEIDISERYEQYLNGTVICPKEQGYFTYKIYYNGETIKSGKIIVSDDSELTNGYANTIHAKHIFTKGSEANNVIKDLPNKNKYILCENTPLDGYEYIDSPCVLIDTGSEDLNY